MAGGTTKGSFHNSRPPRSSSHRNSRGDLGNRPPSNKIHDVASADSKSLKSSDPNENFTSSSAFSGGSARNPIPTSQPVHHSLTSSAPPFAAFPFADAEALGPPPPPPPTYGFHMLDRRPIVLADGTVRSYFALPLDYQDFSPRVRPPDLTGRRFIPPGHGNDGPEPGGFGSDKRHLSGETFIPGRASDDPFERGPREDYWNSLGLESHKSGEASTKRMTDDVRGEERDIVREEFLRQKQREFLQHSNAGLMPNGSSIGVGRDGRGSFFGEGTCNPYIGDNIELDRGYESRSSKFMRVGGSFDKIGFRHHDVDQVSLKKAFLYFAKLINENAERRKIYLGDGKLGSLQCAACGRSSKDFPDMHGLIMHTFNSDNDDLRMDHLGLHRALCVLMGWDYMKSPDNSKGYQFLSAEDAEKNQNDLILWPPVVIFHNTIKGKNKDGELEGFGKKPMNILLKDLGIGIGMPKSYSRDNETGKTIVHFPGDLGGLNEAERLSELYEKQNHGRKKWVSVHSLDLNYNDDKNPNLAEVDSKTGERKRILYAYIGTASDLDKLNVDARKKLVIESRRDMNLA